MAQHAYAPEQIPVYPNSPQVMAGTVGRHAVELADRLHWHEAQPGDVYARGFARTTHEELLSELGSIRNELSGLSPDEKAQLAPYVQSVLPDYVAEEHAHEPSLIDWLADRKKVSDKGMLEFLDRHVENLEQMQADVEGFLDLQQAIFIDNVSVGVIEGWVSEAGWDVARTAVHTRILVGDYWGTHLKSTKGYHRYGSGALVVAQGLGRNRQERNADFVRSAPETITHENCHKEFGTYLSPEYEVIDEAAAEHITMAMYHGEPHILDPDKRAYDSGIYYQRRKLIADVMDGLDASLFTRAVTSRNMDSDEWADLNDELAQKYGVQDVPGSVCRRAQYHVERLRRKNPHMSTSAIGEKAAAATRKELRTDPEVVVGRPQKTKPRHIGSAVLSKNKR